MRTATLCSQPHGAGSLTCTRSCSPALRNRFSRVLDASCSFFSSPSSSSDSWLMACVARQDKIVTACYRQLAA